MTAQVSEVSLPCRPVNAIFWSAGGGATYMSFEYERLFGRDKSFFLAAGAARKTQNCLRFQDKV